VGKKELKERDHLEDLGVNGDNGKINSKGIVRDVRMWPEFMGRRKGTNGVTLKTRFQLYKLRLFLLTGVHKTYQIRLWQRIHTVQRNSKARKHKITCKNRQDKFLH